MWKLSLVVLMIALSSSVALMPPTGPTRNGRTSVKMVQKVGAQNLDWPNLGFEYRPVNSFVEIDYKDGKWGAVKCSSDEYVKIHIGATALHYGQACFEGLKAFQCQDGKVRIFRPQENAARIARSCDRVCMPALPEKLFLEAVQAAVAANMDFVPPYGTGGALYIRPLLYGSGPRIGLQPAEEYKFICMVMPVADYYKGGLGKPVSAVVIEGYDRAAPRGVGAAKVAGNYAADLLPNMEAKKNGYPIGLYLDAKTNTYIEEFSTSNFLAIDKNGAYVTPKSDAILASITNKSLMELAAAGGRDVQHRAVPMQELMDGNFVEAAACGTAVVVTPVKSVLYNNAVHNVGSGADQVGPVVRSLYDSVRAIQVGDQEDTLGWMMEAAA